MSDLAYFEYATVVLPHGTQKEETPIRYLVEVLIIDPETRKERGAAELKRIASQRLSPALNHGEISDIPGLKPIDEADAQKLRKVSGVGSGHDSSAYVVVEYTTPKTAIGNIH